PVRGRPRPRARDRQGARGPRLRAPGRPGGGAPAHDRLAARGDGPRGQPPVTARVMVTGVAGLIGSHLARGLLERGHEVVGVDDLSLGREANLEELRGHPAFRFVRADVLDRAQMEEAASGVATIVHLAALKIPRYDGYLKTLEVNAKGTEVVLECAR